MIIKPYEQCLKGRKPKKRWSKSLSRLAPKTYPKIDNSFNAVKDFRSVRVVINVDNY